MSTSPSPSRRYLAEPRYARPWTERELRILAGLHAAGVSAAEIARRLNRPKDGTLKQLKLIRGRSFPTDRHCELCGKKLARLNTDTICFACRAAS